MRENPDTDGLFVNSAVNVCDVSLGYGQVGTGMQRNGRRRRRRRRTTSAICKTGGETTEQQGMHGKARCESRFFFFA